MPETARRARRVRDIAAAALVLLACNEKDKDAASGAASSGAASAAALSAPSAAASSTAVASPLSIALRSKEPLVLSAVGGGIWVMDSSGRHMASATEGELQSQPAPSGLPEDLERMQSAGGRLPASIWLSAARKPEEGKKKGKTPFYRLTGSKLREIADDWQPLVLPWSKKRVLSLSTSSGRLKVKVLEPLTNKPLAEQPSAHVVDAECAKTLKLVEAAAFGDGAVVATGRCSLGTDKKPSFVALSWNAFVKGEAAKLPDPPAPPATSDSPVAKDDEPPADIGVPMSIIVLGTDQAESSKLRSRAIALYEPDVAEVVGGLEGSNEARLFDIKAPQSTIALPALDSPLVGYVKLSDGERWVATETSLFRQPVGGAWGEVPLPGPGKIGKIAGAGKTLWVSALDGSTGALYVLGSAKVLEW